MKFEEWIKGRKTVNIGWFGGSITAGAGSSWGPKTRYAALVTAGLNAKYPEVEFIETNASIGGTGSSLGIFRLQSDLLDKNPDIVFIEFARNEGPADTKKYMECLVRLLQRYRKDIPIVFVYTLALDVYKNCYAKGEWGGTETEQQKVADYYNIPSINVARDLAAKIGSEEEFRNFFIDVVHPNDGGHASYAETILRELPTLDFNIKTDLPIFSEPVCENPRLVFAEEIAKTAKMDGFFHTPRNLCGRTPTYLWANEPGATLHFEFDGSVIGAYYGIFRSSGSYALSIDGGEWENRTTWDRHGLEFDRIHYCVWRTDLADGHHTVDIKILPDKDPASEGTYFRLGAFLVG